MVRFGVIAASILLLAGCGGSSKNGAPDHRSLQFSVTCPHGVLSFTVPDRYDATASTSVGMAQFGSDGLQSTQQSVGTATYKNGLVTAGCAP